VVAVLARATSLDHPAAAVLALVVGAVAITPLALAFRDRDGAALADPLVLAGWVFWLPMFCLGGVSLALGWNHPYYLDLLADPSAALAGSELWALVGFGALWIGTEVPGLRTIGERVSDRLPRGDWPTGSVRWPAALLVGAGLAVAAIGLATGQIGYEAATRQEVSPIPAYLQTVALLGVALLWFDLVRTPAPGARRVVLTSVAIGGAAVVGAGLAESRAALATWVLVVLLVTAVARVAIPTRLAVGVVAIASVALVLGALVGSTYREIRAEATAAPGAAAGEGSGGRLSDVGTTVGRIAERGAGNVGYVRDRSVPTRSWTAPTPRRVRPASSPAPSARSSPGRCGPTSRPAPIPAPSRGCTSSSRPTPSGSPTWVTCCATSVPSPSRWRWRSWGSSCGCCTPPWSGADRSRRGGSPPSWC